MIIGVDKIPGDFQPFLSCYVMNVENLALVVVGKAEEVLEQIAKFGKPQKVDYLAPVPDEERKTEEKESEKE